MNPIESVTRALGCVLHTPQAEYYLGVGFPGFEGTPPTPREKAYYLRTVRTATDTIQAVRQPVRDMLEGLFVQGSPATPGVRHLVSMLSRVARVCHRAGHEWPDNEDERKRTVEEWGTMEDYFTGWLLMVGEYFPGMAIPPTIPADDPDQVADTVPASTPGKLSILVDRDRLAGCFKGGFKIADRATGLVPFDEFHRELLARVPSYTTTDIGRVAHQVWQSRWAVSRVRMLTFAKWLREFCGMCGATVPADTSPSRYKKTTPATDLSAWLG